MPQLGLKTIFFTQKKYLDSFYSPNILIMINFFKKKWLKQINKFRSANQTPKNSKKLKILIGPSFSLWEPSQTTDRIFAVALEMRGCQIIPIYCDSIQEEECNCVGGDWGGGIDWIRNCKNCRSRSEQMWEPYRSDLVRLSRFVTPLVVKEINNLINNLSFDLLLEFSTNGINYGKLAKDILVNNYLVATINLVPNRESLLRTHIKNLMLLTHCYREVLNELKPDRVISNDSYYGMWNVLQIVSKELNIPFYSHWPATKNRVAIAFNDAAMNLDFKESWTKFSTIPLTPKDNNRIEQWLKGERKLVIDTTKPSESSQSGLSLDNINLSKPTVLLAANVIWDLAALNKQIIFKDMNDWIIETIKWFINNPEFQIIIKPHPVETSSEIPRTRETVSSIILKKIKNLPSNIILLDSDTKLTSRELMRMKNMKGVLVHTTTVGFEYPAHGLPAITTAKSPYRGFGFTIDPVDRDQYFSSIKTLLESENVQIEKSVQELANKFIKFYQFHYYSNLGIFEGNPVMLSKDFRELIHSDEGALNYIIDRIIAGKAINDQENWLPET